MVARTSEIILLGRLSGIDNWSDPVIWFHPLNDSSGVPAGSNGLNIELYVNSTDDLGTAHQPFVANDLIGVAAGLSHPPSLLVTGFLHAHGDLENLSSLSVSYGGRASVDGNVENVPSLIVNEQGSLKVNQDLVDVPQVIITFGSTLELGGTAGFVSNAVSNFQFGIGPNTLILDHPMSGSFNNQISLNPDAIIELAHMHFDQASFIPNSPGSLTGKVQLTYHGKQVYQLADVVENTFSGTTFSVGRDTTTGNDFVSYHLK
jgi:hypothetical protein